MKSNVQKKRRIYSNTDPNPQIAFRLDAKIIRMMDRICKKQIITRSHFVRQLILKELSKKEEKKLDSGRPG
jgi:metal-responsive CopG/Arc/MetJ family transcriptional regulator